MWRELILRSGLADVLRRSIPIPSSLQHALVKRSVDSLSRLRLLLRLRVTPCSAHGLVVQATEYDLLQLANYDSYHTALHVLRFDARSLRPIRARCANLEKLGCRARGDVRLSRIPALRTR